MKRTFLALALISACLLACNTKVEQVKGPSILDDFKDDRNADMAAQPKKALAPNILDETQRRTLCCQQCSEAVAKDRTGQAADKIPCADFTADMDIECVKWFRKTPMKASEAQQCAAENKAADAK